MSRARALPGALSCAVATIVTASLAIGQTVEEYRARVERLTQILEEIELERQEQEREWNEQLLSQLDTVRVGRLSVITTSQYAALVEEAARREWPTVEPALRLESSGEVAEEFVFYLGLPYAPHPGIDELQCSAILTRRARERCPRCPACLGLDGSVQRAIGRLLALRLDPDGSFIAELPFEPLAKGWREGVYAALATADSRSARYCFLGDLASCRDLLGLVQLSEPVTVWYTPEERRRLVSRIGWRGNSALWRSCVEEGSDDACLDLLRSVEQETLTPLSRLTQARRMLLDVALELGGEGVYARISTSSGSAVEERLAVAVSAESDTLVARWREAVLDARPRTQMVSGLEGLAAIAWIVGLAFLATRSSRWRSG
jgi:hypothetical protein